MSQVLEELDKDEPNYDRAAQLGPEAIPHLEQLVLADDPMRASKAAYLATLIPGADADQVLNAASAHSDPRVRVAVAHGASARGRASVELLDKLLDDSDPGVRKVALRAADQAGMPELHDKVARIASDDTEPFLRDMARDTASRLRP
jgi:HEAT repeat protein